ncbi:ATP-dependent endonuclease [Enterobacter hormaechei]
MRLEKVCIKGFRGIKEEITVPIKELNVIVGKNDAGKSTILKALDLFINNRTFYPQFLNNETEKYCEITLCFLPNDDGIVIDDTVITTFQKEGFVNQDGLILYRKTWDGTKVGKISPEISIQRRSYGDKDFFGMTETQLIKACTEAGIKTDKGIATKKDVEAFSNTEKREKLLSYYIEMNYEYHYIFDKVPTQGQNRIKKVEAELKKLMPRFEYFVADSSLDESDTKIQNYFRDLALSTIKNEIDTSESETLIRLRLQKVLDKITAKINAVVPATEQVRARVDFDWSKIISTSFESISNKGAIPLSNRGDGFRRITMMAYFESLAEEIEHQNIIFGFEEPETFLHPSAQENLFDKLFDITKSGYQVIITTHSPVIVAKSCKRHLHHVLKENGDYRYHAEVDNVLEIANDLGIKPDSTFFPAIEKSKLLLLLEGIDDCTAFKYISKKYHEETIIPNHFEELGILTIPIGGCSSIKHWVTLDLIKEFNKPFFIVLDSDKESKEHESPNKKELEQMGFIENVDFNVLRRREIENYFTGKYLERLVPGSSLILDEWCDVKAICKNHALTIRLGGKRVTHKHFCSLTFDELRESFFTQDGDEFLAIYDRLCAKLAS